jgi:uncharacterized protein
MSEIRISQVNVYPIKSCAPIESDTAKVGELGLEHDRAFMLIGSRGQMITQRTHPQLALVKTALTETSGQLEVAAPNTERLQISTEIDEDQPEIEVDLFKKKGTGFEVTDGSEYFSEYLKKAVRLMRIKQPRTIKPECHIDGAVTQTGFADGFPLLLASENSLQELNSHIEQPISIDSFRANLVVKGAEAYDEDYWREIRIGSLRAYVVRACARCPIPNIDQTVGELPKERPVTTALRHYRSGIDPISNSSGEFFGQNLTHVFTPGQTITVDDRVEILRRSHERNFRVNA